MNSSIQLFYLFIITTLLSSCMNEKKIENKNEKSYLLKTAKELENESMNKIHNSDTTLLNFVFGMSKNQVDKHLKKLKSNNTIGDLESGKMYYKIDTKSFIICLQFDLFYDMNNKLFRIREEAIINLVEKKKNSKSNAILKEELLQNYKEAFGKFPLTNGTQQKSDFYWLLGDKRYDYLENGNYCYMVATKISMERNIIVYNEKVVLDSIETDNNEKQKIAILKSENEQKIFKIIKQKAIRNWPEDYVTQEYWINKQINSYKYMLTINDNSKVKKNAQQNWPYDYVTQEFWYNKQIQAKERIQ